VIAKPLNVLGIMRGRPDGHPCCTPPGPEPTEPSGAAQMRTKVCYIYQKSPYASTK
jgi:hypothetical protein